MFVPKIYSHEEVLSELRRMVAASSQTEVSKKLGIGVQMVNDLVHGRRLISDRVAEALGFSRETIFRRKAA